MTSKLVPAPVPVAVPPVGTLQNMPLAQPLPPDPTDPGQDPDLDAMSLEQINAMLDGPKPSPAEEDEYAATEPVPPPPAEPERAIEEELVSAPEETEEEQPLVPEPSIEDRIAELERRHEAEREKFQAERDLLRGHNSRLAGQIGHLQQRLSAPPAEPMPDPGYGEESPRLRSLDERLSAFEQALQTEALQAVISREVAALDAPELRDLEAELAQARTAYAADIEAMNRQTDLDTARLLARGIARSVIADAKTIRWNAERQKAMEQLSTQTDALRTRKIAAGATRTSQPTAPVRAPRKSPDEMTLAEINDALSSLG